MTITWSIGQMDRNAANGGVTVAHWNVSAVDGDYSASAYGTAGFTPDASAPDFKPYANLTEAEVLAWVWASGVDKAAAEASLAQQIAAQKNPVTLNGLPW
jgi:hypothetical protein